MKDELHNSYLNEQLRMELITSQILGMRLVKIIRSDAGETSLTREWSGAQNSFLIDSLQLYMPTKEPCHHETFVYIHKFRFSTRELFRNPLEGRKKFLLPINFTCGIAMREQLKNGTKKTKSRADWAELWVQSQIHPTHGHNSPLVLLL